MLTNSPAVAVLPDRNWTCRDYGFLTGWHRSACAS